MTDLWNHLRALILLACLAAFPANADSRPAVTVAEGQLAGIAENGLHIFRGIPYALPPVGERRWRAPEPPEKWQGVRDASAFGPACVQPPIPGASIYADEPPAMDEDCLSLNIWAPAAAKKAPVIVWIYGGALTRGHTASPLYDGSNFARRGVVFVSINYRIGVLGWLAHPELSAEAPNHVSGNYGLLDQIAALEWVQANIGAFGGDPANVTIMGESAGALSVSYLLSSPLARGLFQKAIAESPNMRNFPVLDKPAYGLPPAEQFGKLLAGKVGADDLNALRAMDAVALTNAAVQARFWPQGTIDGWVLPKQLVDVFDAGEQAPVPVLMGFNAGEVRSQTAFLPPVPATPADYEARINERYADLAPAFLKIYPADGGADSMLATLRDAIYGWAVERMVRSQTALGQPAYLYIFDHCYPAAREKGLCAFHASELPYVFGQVGPDAQLPPNWPRPDGADQVPLSDAMIDYWTGFARAGKPEAAGQPLWGAYGTDQAYMRFAGRPESGTDPVPGMFEMQDELVSRRRGANRPWFINVGVVAEPVPATGGH